MEVNVLDWPNYHCGVISRRTEYSPQAPPNRPNQGRLLICKAVFLRTERLNTAKTTGSLWFLKLVSNIILEKSLYHWQFKHFISKLIQPPIWHRSRARGDATLGKKTTVWIILSEAGSFSLHFWPRLRQRNSLPKVPWRKVMFCESARH